MIGDLAVKLGMTANVTFGSSAPDDLIAVPATALFYQGQQPCVWALSNGKDQDINADVRSIEPIQVDVVRLDQESVHISSPELRGREIVAAGVHKLSADSKVRVWTR